MLMEPSLGGLNAVPRLDASETWLRNGVSVRLIVVMWFGGDFEELVRTEKPELKQMAVLVDLCCFGIPDNPVWIWCFAFNLVKEDGQAFASAL